MNEEYSNEYTIKQVLLGLKKIARHLQKKWLIILLCSFIGGILGYIYRINTKTVYRASISFVSETSSADGLGSYASIASSFGIDLGQGGGGAFEGDNLIEVLKSRKLIVKTLFSNKPDSPRNHLLLNDYIYLHNINSDWKEKVNLKSLVFDKDSEFSTNRIKDSIINLIYKQIVENKLSIDRKDKKLNFIALQFDDIDEEFSKTFSELLCYNATQFYTEYKTKKATQNINSLKRQCDSLRNLLGGSIETVAAVADLNINPSKQMLRSNVQKRQVDVQANTAMYTEVMKQLAIAKVTLQKESPLIQVIDTPVLPLKKLNIGRIGCSIIGCVLGFLIITSSLTIRFKFKDLNIS
jgi:hypothetical protein